MGKLTFTMENYLEAIYELAPDGSGARVSDIAERLGVTKASTNSAMSTLSEKGLIVNEKYKEVYLTEAGLALARFTSNKHHVIARFFTAVLGLTPELSDADACAIEHVISDQAIYAMEKHLIGLLPSKKEGGEPPKSVQSDA